MAERSRRRATWARSAAFLLAAAGANAVAQEPAPRIVFEREIIDFGTMLTGAVGTLAVDFRNAGDADLRIERFQANCGCVKPIVIAGERRITPVGLRRDGRPLVLRPGQEARLEVEFNGKGRRGEVKKKIYFFSDDPAVPRAELDVVAHCDLGYTLEPRVFDFGDSVIHGTAATRSVMLMHSARWKGKITKTSYNIKGVVARWKEETFVADGGETGKRTRIDLTITADAEVGHVRWPLALQTDSSEVPVIRIPVRAEVTPVVQCQGADGKRIRAVDFGQLGASDPVSREVLIVNHEPGVPYTVRRTVVTSRQEDHLEAVVIPREDGARLVLRLTVLPTMKRGNFNGSVLLESDHATVPALRVFFRGVVTRR